MLHLPIFLLTHLPLISEIFCSSPITAFKAELPNKINIFGIQGCGKTHLGKILQQKINSFLINADNVSTETLNNFKTKECLIIDNYNNNIDEKLLYSILNYTTQYNKYIVINSLIPLKIESTGPSPDCSVFEIVP